MAVEIAYGGRTAGYQDHGQGFVATETTLSSSKTFTVPTGALWLIHNIHCVLIATADVGNRQIQAVVTQGGVTVGTFNAVAVVVASGTEYFNFAPIYGTATETPATMHYVPFPTSVLEGGATIKIWDATAVHPDADSLTVAIAGVQF
jgi:hypothetical protein